MRTRYEHNGLVWLDMESPTRDEIEEVVEHFGIAQSVAQELLLPSTKPRAEGHPGYAYLVVHFPALRHSHRTREQEIDFVVGPDFLITVRYDTIDPLHKFSKVFEVASMLDKSDVGNHAGYLFFAAMKKLYKSVEHEVEYIRHELSAIEEHIFSGHEVEMVSAISRSARDLLSLRQTIEPHREVLRELEIIGPRLFGEDFSGYLRSLSDEYYRVHNHIVRSIDSLHELRETNNSLLSTKQNETMKLFTIMAFVTLPLTLVAALFSMDTEYTPIVGHPHDFWIIFGLMLGGATTMFFFFRRRKWL